MARTMARVSEERSRGRTRRARNGRDEAFWREMVALQRDSGRGLKRFCQERGLPESTFTHWRRKLKASRHGAQFLAVPWSAPAAGVPGGQRPEAPACWMADASSDRGALVEVLLPGMRLQLSGAHAQQMMSALLSRLAGCGW